ncbi:hypothetical protein AX15_001634 [Amanita polypyramis BW_CC]|nr:hypothetical protein AX15_001634 [Amanita polypyramis BW_CC]
MQQPTFDVQVQTLALSDPFDSNAPADIILRSSDTVDFFTISLLLSFVSPVFRNMFPSNDLIGAAENETRMGLPIIHMTEDSQTIRQLLFLIYPFSSESSICDAGLCMKLGKMSQKYLMDAIEIKLQKIVLASQLIKSEAFRIYTIAVHLKWREVANVAASNTLNISLNDLLYVEELQNISSSDFHRFLQYRFKHEVKSTIPPTDLVGVSSWHPHQSSEDPVDSVAKPFDAASGGDVILRSSDKVDFFVLKALIRIMSPVLSDLISTSQVDDGHGPTIVPLKENSRTIHHLFAIIYNCVDVSDMQEYQLLLNVGKAAQEYKIERVEAILKDRLSRSGVMAPEPFKVYAIAFALGWNEIARTAAMRTLDTPFEEMEYGDELNSINGAALFRFMEYRLKCEDVACRLLSKANGFQLTAAPVPAPSSVVFLLPPSMSPSPFFLTEPSTSSTGSLFSTARLPKQGGRFKTAPSLSTAPSLPIAPSPSKWLRDYVTTIKEKLRIRPRGASVMDDNDLKTAIDAYEVEICKQEVGGTGSTEKEPKYSATRLFECRRALAKAIDEAISKVPLHN